MSNGIATTLSFPYHLDRDIWKIFFQNMVNQKMTYPMIAKIGDAPAGTGGGYTEAVLSNLGNLLKKDEGRAIQFDTPEEGDKQTYYPDVFSLGFQLTYEMGKDDKFGNFKKMPAELGRSAAYKPELEFYKLFNFAFVTTYHTGGDGKALCADDHTTIKSGDTIDNQGTAAALSETSLQAAFEYFDSVVDHTGRPRLLNPKYLVTGKDLRFTSQKLMRNLGAIGTGNNDMNTVNPANNIVSPYVLINTPQITSSTAWFLLAEEHDLRLWWLERTKFRAWDDPNTLSRLFMAYQRFMVFFHDYAGVYGNAGA